MQLHFQMRPRLKNRYHIVVRRFMNSSGGRIWQEARPATSMCWHGVHMPTRAWFIPACIRIQPGTNWSRADVTFGDMNAHQHKHRWIRSVRFPF